MSYTFPLAKKYSNFKVIFDESALYKNFEFTLVKKGDVYSYGGEKELKREELTDEILKKIKGAEMAEANEILRHDYGEPISQKSASEIIIDKKPAIKPIFEAWCENDEKGEAEKEEEPKELTAIERNNGFYTVTNFDGEYNSSKYKYAKEASITKKDVSSVNKVISDNGGYEIEFIFTESGTAKLKEFIENNVQLGKPIVVVISNHIVSDYFSYSLIGVGKANVGDRLTEKQIDEFIENFKK